MEEISKNFIELFIDEDLAPGGQYEGRTVHTRFPPEPNGYLHIGHCKALIIDFGTAEKFGGMCNLRMDDTNPTKEDVEYVDAIMDDIKWLGFEWDNVYFASDYFDYIYECALKLIKKHYPNIKWVISFADGCQWWGSPLIFDLLQSVRYIAVELRGTSPHNQGQTFVCPYRS